jgi:hypothetical protein
MGDKTVLAISRVDANELRIKLESHDFYDQAHARRQLADLLWEAVTFPPDLTWLKPATTCEM